jgi:thiamine biosynthesis lipoprotein
MLKTTKTKKFMNTDITVHVVNEKQNTVKTLDAIEAVYSEFDRIVKRYTRFNEDSELSNLNRSSGTWVTVTPEFFKLVQFMLDLNKNTNGVFDPTIIDFLEIYGYNKDYDFSKLENPLLDSMVKEISEKRAKASQIELNEKELSVKLVKGQKIELGGCGKGYALDQSRDILLNLGFSNFLIDGGGDLIANGVNDKGEEWEVGLYTFENGEKTLKGATKLNNEALASSGGWARKVKQFHHLINPTNGTPENKFNTVFVRSKDAILADSLATTLFVGGEDAIKHYSSQVSCITF